MNTSIPRAEDGIESNLIKQGVGEYLVYERDIPKVMAMVEPYPEAVDRSRRTYERKLRAYVKDKMGLGPLQEVPEDRALWTDRMNQVERTFDSNPTAEFTAEYLRGPLSLISCEVIGDAPPPMDDNDLRQIQNDKQQMAMMELQNKMLENVLKTVVPQIVQQVLAVVQPQIGSKK